jgi:hypothetical protein
LQPAAKQWQQEEPGNRIKAFLQSWATSLNRPIVLFIDELDSLQDETLISNYMLSDNYKNELYKLKFDISDEGRRKAQMANIMNKPTADGRSEIKVKTFDRKYRNLTDDEKTQLKTRVGISDDRQLLNSIMDDPDYQVGQYNIGGFGIKPKKRSNFIGFGISEINNKSLENNIVKIRRPSSKSNYMDLPSKRVSSHMKNIISRIAGGGMPAFEDLSKMDNDEKIYLNKLLTKADLKGRLSVPAPSKDQEEKEIHEFEVLKGQIMSGNDSIQLVKKFKLLIRKLCQKQMLPRSEVNDMLDVLNDLGY